MGTAKTADMWTSRPRTQAFASANAAFAAKTVDSTLPNPGHPREDPSPRAPMRV